MEVVTQCPLGSECEEAKDGKLYRCRWYMHIRGTHPQTGEPVDEWNCVLVWAPILTIENAQMSRQTGAAVESLRNEIVARADKASGPKLEHTTYVQLEEK